MSLAVTATYVAAAANRFHKCASVSQNGSLVAFGSHKLIALWSIDSQDSQIIATLEGPTAAVTSVSFLTSDTIASGDEDGWLFVWHRTDESAKWNVIFREKVHKCPISVLSSCGEMLVSGSSDAMVNIWKQNFDSGLDMLQELNLGNDYPLDVVLAILPESESMAMAIATTASNIQIWAWDQSKFERKVYLSGHEDWVRSLSLAYQSHNGSGGDHGTLFLASGSQDGSIRMWAVERICGNIEEDPQGLDPEIIDTLLYQDYFDTSSRRVIFSVECKSRQQHFHVRLDSLLIGHEAAITSLQWNPSSLHSGFSYLLSTSTDSSLIIWGLVSTSKGTFNNSSSDSLWIIRQRFGDIGGQRFGGFVGGLWGRNGHDALAYGWNGSWRRWCKVWSIENSEKMEKWIETVALTGHQGPIKGLAWSNGGEYLISTGSDQTTRIHAPSASSHLWHEVARPQVHGYDLLDAVPLNILCFASIAEEKVVRVFEAPQHFIRIMKSLGSFQNIEARDRVQAAKLPPLGLSNKAIEDDSEPAEIIEEPSDNTAIYRTESYLVSRTLWPEKEKVFGHGYELMSLASSHSGGLIATSCKATTSEHAVVRLYDTRTWQSFGPPLQGHALTITRLSWSSDDHYLLSVSRDRTWRIFSLIESKDKYIPLAWNKAHSRVIWDCAWIPQSHVFATAARDKTIQIWGPNEDMQNWHRLATLNFTDPVTAIDFALPLTNGMHLLAVGLETGNIMIYINNGDNLENWFMQLSLNPSFASVGRVHRLAWRLTKDTLSRMDLAIGGEDQILRIVTFRVSDSEMK